jgi:Mrp family chromosome partitioning ATPase
MKRILEEAASRFDWVILDGPPIGPLADASLLARIVEGTLFVIRAGYTPHASVQQAIEAIGRKQILGVVLNGTQDRTYETYGANSDSHRESVSND